jgi:hypothetical protein
LSRSLAAQGEQKRTPLPRLSPPLAPILAGKSRKAAFSSQQSRAAQNLLESMRDNRSEQ